MLVELAEPDRLAAVLIYARNETASEYAQAIRAQALARGDLPAAQYWSQVLFAVNKLLASIRNADQTLH